MSKIPEFVYRACEFCGDPEAEQVLNYVTGLLKDAERYRWLRDNDTMAAGVFILLPTTTKIVGGILSPSETDAVIDAEMEAT